ncbi:MAG: FeoB-associated Cys-rich membrane protein [Finegoldia sp.]|nr:FeoB-associated Cys-rich membrane protein [Finegoldia sp.]
MADFVIVLVLIVAVVMILRNLKKNGGACDCGCSSCPHSKNCKVNRD